MIIRNEKPSDIDAIVEVIKAAFKDHSSCQQTEQFIVRDLRAAGALAISLVAEVDGRLVGHIAFSPVTISDGTKNWHGLGPVSVLPDFQGCRIGTALVDNGLVLLKSMGGKGCALVGMPAYYKRFGFTHHLQLIHEEAPREIFTTKPLSGPMPSGKVEFHQAFKQLSAIEKDAVADFIIDYAIAGVRVDLSNPAIESLMGKEILTEMPGGKFMLRPAALAVYDTYLARVTQFRAAEMGRVHKNPLLAAVKS